MLSFEVESASTVFRVLTRQMLDVVLWSVFNALSMNADFAVAMTASNALASGPDCLGHCHVLPPPLSAITDNKLSTLLTADH